MQALRDAGFKLFTTGIRYALTSARNKRGTARQTAVLCKTTLNICCFYVFCFPALQLLTPFPANSGFTGSFALERKGLTDIRCSGYRQWWSRRYSWRWHLVLRFESCWHFACPSIPLALRLTACWIPSTPGFLLKVLKFCRPGLFQSLSAWNPASRHVRLVSKTFTQLFKAVWSGLNIVEGFC